MNSPSPTDYLIDPLGSITRLERRNLLLSATIGLLFSKAGLVPTEFTTLGIKLSAPQQSAFLVIVALSIAYFFVAFLAYGLPDFFIWRKKYQDYRVLALHEEQNWSREDQEHNDETREVVPHIAWLYRLSPGLAYTRLFFEYLVPLLFSAYSAYTLLVKANAA